MRIGISTPAYLRMCKNTMHLMHCISLKYIPLRCHSFCSLTWLHIKCTHAYMAWHDVLLCLTPHITRQHKLAYCPTVCRTLHSAARHYVPPRILLWMHMLHYVAFYVCSACLHTDRHRPSQTVTDRHRLSPSHIWSFCWPELQAAASLKRRPAKIMCGNANPMATMARHDSHTVMP